MSVTQVSLGGNNVHNSLVSGHDAPPPKGQGIGKRDLNKRSSPTRTYMGRGERYYRKNKNLMVKSCHKSKGFNVIKVFIHFRDTIVYLPP